MFCTGICRAGDKDRSSAGFSHIFTEHHQFVHASNRASLFYLACSYFLIVFQPFNNYNDSPFQGNAMKYASLQMISAALLMACAGVASAKDVLFANERLPANQYLQSASGSHRFILQGDGNIVLYSASRPLWASNTVGKGGVNLYMQGDGNLVLRNKNGASVWSTGTQGKGANRASMQDNGNFVLLTSSNASVWATNTQTDGAGDNGEGGGSGGSFGSITHVGTSQVWDSDGQGVRLNRPSNSREGDLLVLVLHRTDDVLPFAVSGWTRRAECFKEDNGYQCVNVSDCTSVSGNFCTRFSSKYTGRDLAQVVFTRTASASEPSSYSFDLNQDSSGHPGWAILSALRGANTNSPVRATANRGCDGSDDSLFPSVEGRRGDMLLLSQSFDDAVSRDRFGAPSGMSTFGYVSNSDEAGFLYGGPVSADGPTGIRQTTGSGASGCKDALVSLTVRPQ